jgi:hypothetical protein
VVDDDELSKSRTNSRPERQSRLARTVDRHKTVKAKVFEVILHKLPSGRSPASTLEEQFNGFLAQSPELRVAATHLNK